MATTTAKIGPKYQLVIPKQLRAAAKLKIGDFLKAELRGDGILLTPMDLVERDLAAAEADVKAGRVLGPFTSARQAVRALKAFGRRRPHARSDRRNVR
jgi:AbrB family looped-hinge helix DNA binding protein